MKVKKSRGLYAAPQLPRTDSVADMEDLEEITVDYGSPTPFIGNRYVQPQTKRMEITLPGDWTAEGKFAVRQVDPVHFEISSIILDADVEFRNSRGS